MTREENAQDPQFIAEHLREDHVRLRQWISSDLHRLAAVHEEAAEVRTQAEQVVHDTSLQGAERQSLEDDLFRAKEHVHSALNGIPTEQPQWLYLAFGEQPKLRDYVEGRVFGHWADPVEDSDYGERISNEEDKLLAAASHQYASREEARADAERAVKHMDRTVRCALDWSTTCFGGGETAPVPDQRPAKASTVPLAAFVLVALAGVDIAPTPIAGWIAIAFLLVVVVLSAHSILSDDRRGISIATLAGGSSLAFFTAAYLAVRIIDPADLLRSGTPISSIAEAAFTSLTVGVTGGAIGTDLGGAARIVAFIQILLTVGAVASGIAWAWRRLVDRPDDQGTPTPRVEELR
jgi:hypothetical protein